MSHPLAPDWLIKPADVNALDQKIWPAHARRDQAGQISIGGVSSSHLVEQFGSPLYVLDLDDVVERARSVEAVLSSALAVSGRTLRIHYATKALLAADVVRTLDGLGWGFDVSSF
ncbi:MAG: diaminopimelate decarboxylase, partial [Pontimonas sp.]